MFVYLQMACTDSDYIVVIIVGNTALWKGLREFWLQCHNCRHAL